MLIMLFDNPTLAALKQLPAKKAEMILVKAAISHPQLNITGSGRIYQDDEGELFFQVINHDPPSPETESRNFLQSLSDSTGARRMEASDYAKLTAVDDHGCHITCDYIDIDGFYDRAVYEGTFRSNISFRKVAEKPFLADRASIVFKNKYSFATNDFDTNPNTDDGHLENRTEWRHTWKVDAGDIQFTFHKDIKNLQLDIIGSELNLEKLKQITYALDFVMGLEHSCYYQILFEENSAFFEAVMNKDATSFVPGTIFQPPYQRTGNRGNEDDENAKLFVSYYHYLSQHPTTLLTKWHKRLVDAGTGYYYRFGLILSIGIEKILQELYPNDIPKPSYDVTDIGRIQTLAETLHNEVLQQRLKDFVQRLNSNNYVPGKMLEKLEIKGVISKGATASWKKLRNSYAHGADNNDDVDKGLDLLTQNSTLYHELIFHKIGYHGKYINFFLAKNGKAAEYPIVVNS